MPTYHIRLDQLRPHLAPGLERSLESVPGVQSVMIETAARRVVVEHDDTDLDPLVDAIRDEGYEPSFE